MNWILITRLVSFLFAATSCAFLTWQEMIGVGLLLLSIMTYEKSKMLVWIAQEAERRVAEAARREEAMSKREADLKSRVPGQGRVQP